MNKNLKLFFSLLIFTLNLSCVVNESGEKENTNSGWVATTKADSLRFTSGIRAIFQDSKGNFWFGSLQEGVAVYDGKSFTYLTINEGLTDNQIHSIQEDKDGVIWIDTQTGISSYDGSRVINHTVSSKGNSQNDFPIQGNESEPGEWMKSDSDLWFEAGTISGVYRYDGQRLHYLDLPPQKILNPNNNLFAVTDISYGRNNMIWFGTYAGVFGYNGNEFTTINDETLGLTEESEKIHARSILEDSQGRLWIGNNGIGVLLKEGDSIINFSEKNNLIHPISGRNGDQSPPGTLEHVFTIAEDSQGNIWFGDRDAGIWKYNDDTMVNYTKAKALSNDFALSIYEDRNNEIWFGMADGSIYRFNGKTFEKKF